MYYIMTWDTKETLHSTESLPEARRICRNLGHTGEDIFYLTGYPPIAYVADDNGDLVYNPRFEKVKIGE